MGGSILSRRSERAARSRHFALAGIVGLWCALHSTSGAQAAEQYDPFDARPQFHDPFEAKSKPRDTHKANNRKRASRDPFDETRTAALKAAPLETAYEPRNTDSLAQQVNYQIPPADQPAPPKPLSIAPPENTSPPADAAAPAKQSVAANDPCAAAAEKPLFELGIGIEPPAGQLPTNLAATCWDSINSRFGPIAGLRSWAGFNYQWDATCFCHRPLYFEEINLERYGYGCGWCLQPAASAAHFFGTVPALPYCMAVDCPQECIYTLGHYRPGSCPPWRHHWPPCDPLAAAAEGGVLTGLIFLIP